MSSPTDEHCDASSEKGELSLPPSSTANLNNNDAEAVSAGQRQCRGTDDPSNYRVRDGYDGTSGLNPRQRAENSIGGPSTRDDESLSSLELEDTNARFDTTLGGDTEYSPPPSLPPFQIMPNGSIQDPIDNMQDVGQMLGGAGFASGHEDTSVNNPSFSPLDIENAVAHDSKHPEEANQAEETRTKTERYHKEGRGSQMCNLCGQPRKNHECEFKYPSAHECKEMRAEFLAAFRFTAGDDAVKYCQEAFESWGTAMMFSNQSDQEGRTKTSRYNKEGRGAQRCNLCGRPRKKHACLFTGLLLRRNENDDVNRRVVKGFLDKYTFEAILTAVQIKEWYVTKSEKGADDIDSGAASSEGCAEGEVDDESLDVEGRAKKRRKSSYERKV
jgi:ribosomal protein S14